MNRTHTQAILLLAICLFGAVAIAPVDGIAGTNDFDLTWHTIDGGGGASVGDGFELSGTVGQPDAGTMSRGGFELSGGFWAGTVPADPACTIVADFNCDGVVNVLDMLVLLGDWGACGAGQPCPADLNGDNTVNVLDLLMLLTNWG